MTLHDRILRLNDSIDRLADGRRLYCYFVTAIEMGIFNMSSTNLFLYDMFSKNFYERRKYLSDRDKEKLEALNDKNVKMLMEKSKFDDSFTEFLCRDYIYPHKCEYGDFVEFVKKHPTYMAKANWACEGIGIEKYTVKPEDDLKKLYQYYYDEYILLEEVLIQHEEMAKLNPSSVNTVRIATLNHNGKVHIIVAALRIGAGGDTDNLHGGGVCCSVDEKTGITQSIGFDGNQNRYLKHPLTGHIIPGFQIPNWDKVIETSIKAAEKVPQFKWIGWDIAITQDGVAIIEGNHNQGVDLIQIGGKGLKPVIKEILKS